MQLRLIDENPTAGPAAPELERTHDLVTENTRDDPMTWRGARMGVQHAERNFAHDIGRKRFDISVCRRAWFRIGHAKSGLLIGQSVTVCAKPPCQARAVGR